jgi:membrane-associated protease RseP (regulator of RpoE activity)
MKKQISIALLGVALALVPATLHAQFVYGQSARRAWLGLSYETTFQGTGAARTQTIVITDIVANSPAQHAGLEPGDTLLRVNDIDATDQLLSSLGVSLKPGDTVELRVRRAGRERDVRVEAGTPPAGYYEIAPSRGIMTLDADSMRDRIRIMFDSARIGLDSLRFPNVYIERMPYGLRIGGDSVFFRGDTARFRAFRFDSLGVHIDSMMTRFQFFTDSVLSRDSMWFQARPGGARVFGFGADSAFMGGFFGLNNDSAGGLRRLDALPFAGISVWGARAIAGAELTELSPELGEYFGSNHGVLVLRVPDGTPAADAGLQAGDVIVGAAGSDVTSIDELRRAILRGTERTIPLEIVRRRETIRIDFRRD